MTEGNVHPHRSVTAEVMQGSRKTHRWYLGGVASASAAACTHPLDLLKAS